MFHKHLLGLTQVVNEIARLAKKFVEVRRQPIGTIIPASQSVQPMSAVFTIFTGSTWPECRYLSEL
jgi:hypothetical protein